MQQENIDEERRSKLLVHSKCLERNSIYFSCTFKVLLVYAKNVNSKCIETFKASSNK